MLSRSESIIFDETIGKIKPWNLNFLSGVSWNTTGVFETNKLRFGTSNFCSNEFVNFNGCKFSCTTFQKSNQCKHSTATIPFHFTLAHCHSHLKGEVEVGQKRIKTCPPVLQPIFLFGPPSHPFWGCDLFLFTCLHNASMLVDMYT